MMAQCIPRPCGNQDGERAQLGNRLKGLYRQAYHRGEALHIGNFRTMMGR